MHLLQLLLDWLVGSGLVLGYVFIFLIIFAESGLLIGFFLPGDSLLFSLGLLTSQGHFSIGLLVLVGCLAAVLGDSAGYWFGRKVGPALFTRKDSLLFKKENVFKAQQFYEEYGKKTIVLARFIPVVRTFAPIVAGVAEMEYTTFITYNLLGGVGWVSLVACAGYYLGTRIPNIDNYLLPIIMVIVILSVLPAVYHLQRSKRQS